MDENVNKAEPHEAVEIDPGEIELIADIFRTLTKTIKTFNAYPSDNPIYQKFAQDLYHRFSSFFESHDELTLAVEQYSLLFSGHEVFRSEDRNDNIAFLLYADAIREITFHFGLTLDEIIDFIDILRLAPKGESLEDDIVTLLWEKDIEHLSFFVPQDLQEDETMLEDDFLPDEEMEPVSSAQGATYSDLTVRPFQMELRVDPVDNVELNDIRTEAAKLESGFLLSSALELLFDMIEIERDISSFALLARNIKKIIDIKMDEDDRAVALGILKRLSLLAGRLESGEYADIVMRIINEMGTVESIKKIMSSNVDPALLQDYLASLGPSSASSIIEVLAETEDRKRRRIICDVLSGHAQENMEAFEKAISDDRWYLVRNIVMVLGKVRDEKSIPLISRTVRHKELRVRREAVKALESMHSPETKKPLLVLLTDEDPAIRVSALRALRRYGGGDLFSYLDENIRKSDFKEKNFSEKREFLEAYGQLGRMRSLPLLKQLFMKKSFFRSEENLELRACAAYGLGFAGGEEAVNLLRSEGDSKKSLLREACVKALNDLGKHEEN